MVFRTGFFLGLGLVSSIGAQNVFLIKQSVCRKGAFFCASMCCISDAALILLGVTSVNKLFIQVPTLKQLLLVGGIIFLLYYGYQSLRSCLRADYKELTEIGDQVRERDTYLKLIILSLGFSLLNPNAILDMFVLLGGFASHYTGAEQYEFAFGVITSSLIWFFGIVILMRLLARQLLKPIVWRWIDGFSAGLMFFIALLQVWQLFVTD